MASQWQALDNLMTMHRWGIIFLQETHLDVSDKRDWKDVFNKHTPKLPSCQWQGKGYFSANLRPIAASSKPGTEAKDADKTKDNDNTSNTRSGGVAILISSQAPPAVVVVEESKASNLCASIPALTQTVAAPHSLHHTL